MNVKFYLKRPKSKTPTVICAQINYNLRAYRYYLPYQVNPGDWDFKSQRMRLDVANGEVFNQLLACVTQKINGKFYAYLNKSGGYMPTVEIYRQLLDQLFKKM